LKVLGFVIIIIGLIMVYVGITGNQHNLMATITGSTSPAASGQPINLPGTSSTASSNSTNAATQTQPTTSGTTGSGGGEAV
jgi:hypothetical protein